MSPTFSSRGRRITALSLTLFAATTVLTACDDDDPIQPIDPVEWQAQLAGVGEYEDVEGIAAASAQPTAFEAEIEIAGAEADAVFTWRVAEGTCAEPGDRIGAANRYPDLEVEEDGTAAAEADVIGVLDEDEEYIVSVLDESGAATVVVACGALEVDE